jgi:RecG-like helicase
LFTSRVASVVVLAGSLHCSFGEMVVSALYELPPGRQPVATQVVADDEQGQQLMYRAIQDELAAGRWPAGQVL